MPGVTEPFDNPMDAVPEVAQNAPVAPSDEPTAGRADEAAGAAPVALPPEAAAEAPGESLAEMFAEEPEVLEEPIAEMPAEEPEVVEEPIAEMPAEAPAEPVVEPPTKARVKAAPVVVAPAPPPVKSDKMQWYILKVQSNREDSIREGLLRRVAIAGLGEYFGDVIVPIEKVTEVKGGKKRVVKRKLYPGYLVVQMEINEDTWFLVRETPGIGDFTGAAGHPTAMLPHEVARIVSTQEEKTDATPKLQIGFRPGDRIKINEGTFENFEGEVETIDETSGRVTVMINIFGRSTPVELEYWQIETL
jgi:transcription termination/antitermination protein NusG